MVKEIKSIDLELLKNNDCTVLLIYAEGCAYCDEVKPKFEEQSHLHPKLTFLKAELNEIKDFYVKYADTQTIQNEDGSEIEAPVFTIPNCYIFVKELQDSDDEFGFAGGFEGAAPGELENVLEALSNRVSHSSEG